MYIVIFGINYYSTQCQLYLYCFKSNYDVKYIFLTSLIFLAIFTIFFSLLIRWKVKKVQYIYIYIFFWDKFIYACFKIPIVRAKSYRVDSANHLDEWNGGKMDALTLGSHR